MRTSPTATTGCFSSSGRSIATKDQSALIEHAERAVDCDPMEANGYLFRSLACSVQGKRDEVLVNLRRAVELNPSMPVARSLLGQFLGIAGRTEEGLRELDTAIRLSPKDPQLWTFHAGKAVVFFNASPPYEESRAASERALEIDPEFASATAFSNIAATSALVGDLPRAQAALADTLRVWPNMSVATFRTVFASIPTAPSRSSSADALAGWVPKRPPYSHDDVASPASNPS